MSEFGTKELLDCYRRGLFPMADNRDDPQVFLLDPEERGVIPLDGLHISRSPVSYTHLTLPTTPYV